MMLRDMQQRLRSRMRKEKCNQVDTPETGCQSNRSDLMVSVYLSPTDNALVKAECTKYYLYIICIYSNIMKHGSGVGMTQKYGYNMCIPTYVH